jgi:hypothetical protein
MVCALRYPRQKGRMPGLFDRTGNAEKDAIIASAEAAYALCQGIKEACEELAHVNASEAADSAGESLVDVVRWL